MAYTKTSFTPDDYDVQKVRYHRLGPGEAPSLGQIPAPYLPVTEQDHWQHGLWFVLQAGRFVAFDQTSLNSGDVDNSNWLVWANGLVAQTVTYTSNDVSLVPDIDEYDSGNTTAVASAGDATKEIAANFPCGMIEQNLFSQAYDLAYHNVKPQDRVTFITRGLVELPLQYHAGDGAQSTVARSAADPGDRQDSLVAGCLCVPGRRGWPVRWESPISVDQICGRVLRVPAVSVRDSLDKVHTVPGLSDLPGTGTSGRRLHENYTLSGSTTLVGHMVEINLNVL